MLDELKNIKSGIKELRDFGLVVGGVLVVFGAVAMWRGKPFYPYLYTVGALLILMGVAWPAILKPLQKAWMALGIIIGFFMSKVVLGILFYGVITPIGLTMKVFGKDILDERIEISKASYWKARTDLQRPPESYEKQF